jgi:hypothetical protein
VNGFQSYLPVTHDVAAIPQTPQHAFINTGRVGGYWYWVDASGAISTPLHAATQADSTANVDVAFDSTYMYLLDTDAHSLYHLSKIPNDGRSPATDIYSGPGFFQYPSLALAGLTDGSVLLDYAYSMSPILDSVPACPCAVIDVLKSGAGSALIPGFTSFVGSFSVWQSASSTEYLLQTTNAVGSSNTTTIIDKHGPVLQPAIAQSTFLGTAGSVLLETRSASDPAGISGAEIHQLVLGSSGLVDSVLTLPNGGGYTLPTLTQSPRFVPLNATIAAVCLSTTVGPVASSAVTIVDTSKKQIGPVDLPNSAVTVLMPYSSYYICPQPR